MHSAGSHLSKDMLDLIKSIGDSRSKQEEDKIISRECESLKKRISEGGISPKKMKEYLIRAIYVEMLGHEAPFSHLFAVNLTQDKNILNKRVGYLACSLLLNEQNEFLILLVASLQKDIQSSNWVEVTMALNTVIKFADPTLMQAVTEPILKLLDHKNEQIRKKAVMCLHRFYQVDPRSVPDCEDRMRKLICDYDPSVMAATLPYFREQATKNPEKYKDLVNPLIVILKQIIEHKLPRDFDYHRFPAPWIQVIILEILSILGRDDQKSSENMYEILGQCMRRADDTGINIGYAIVYQCLKTICTIYPNPHLIELASNTISRFLSSESPNLRCTGINGLTLIIQINPNYVMSHQKVIVDCLEENDETLKKNTFELLYKMTNLKNVEVIVDKMMNYLKHTTLENVSKKELLTKITELTERFAPNKSWFVKIMNELFVDFGEMITDDILSKLTKIIAEWEKESDDLEEFKKFTIENYANIVENYAVLPDSLVKLIAWVAGEYANELYQNDTEKLSGILQMLAYLLNKNYDDEMTKCLLITAIEKIHSNMNFIQLDVINDIFEKYSRDKFPEIQQRCLEYKRIIAKEMKIEKNEFTTIGDGNEIDKDLSFLNDYIEEKSAGKKYNEQIAQSIADKFSSGDVQLNVGPYDVQTSLSYVPSKKTEGMNNLYESKDNNLRKNMKNELVTNNVAQKWSSSGYTGGNTVTSTNTTFNPTNTASVGSSEFSVSNNNKTPNNISYQGVSSNDVYSSSYNNAYKKQEPKIEENSEKKKLMNDLFGGMTTNTAGNKPTSQNKGGMFSNNPTQNNNNNNNIGGGLFSGLSVKDSQNNKPQVTQTVNNNVNLLGFDIGDNTTNNNNNNVPQNTQTQKNTIDLLGDIFGGNNQNQTVSPPQQNQSNNNNNNNVLNLFDIGGGNNQMNENKINNNTNDIFMNLNSNPYTPYQIDTNKFGEIWENSPDEDSFEMNININTPQQFHEIIKNKGNFCAIEIINNEAISSANYKNQIALVHATINPGHVDLLVKCQNKQLNNEVANYVINLFK